MTTIVFTFERSAVVTSTGVASGAGASGTGTFESTLALASGSLLLSLPHPAPTSAAMKGNTKIARFMRRIVEASCDAGVSRRRHSFSHSRHRADTSRCDARHVRRAFVLVAGASLVIAACKHPEQSAPAPAPVAPKAPSASPPSQTAFYASTFTRTPSVAQLTAIGRALFGDPSLSASGKLACAT